MGSSKTLAPSSTPHYPMASSIRHHHWASNASIYSINPCASAYSNASTTTTLGSVIWSDNMEFGVREELKITGVDFVHVHNGNRDTRFQNDWALLRRFLLSYMFHGHGRIPDDMYALLTCMNTYQLASDERFMKNHIALMSHGEGIDFFKNHQYHLRIRHVLDFDFCRTTVLYPSYSTHISRSGDWELSHRAWQTTAAQVQETRDLALSTNRMV